VPVLVYRSTLSRKPKKKQQGSIIIRQRLSKIRYDRLFLLPFYINLSLSTQIVSKEQVSHINKELTLFQKRSLKTSYVITKQNIDTKEKIKRRKNLPGQANSVYFLEERLELSV
jgi:hypothetical protein